MTSRERFEEAVKAAKFGILVLNKRDCKGCIGDGEYLFAETRRALAIWQAAERSAIEAAIAVVTKYEVSVGNSPAGEIACEMTVQNLQEIRDELKELLNEH